MSTFENAKKQLEKALETIKISDKGTKNTLLEVMIYGNNNNKSGNG